MPFPVGSNSEVVMLPWRFLLSFLFVTCLCCSSGEAAEPVKMTFAGSGSNLYITTRLAEAFQKKNPKYRIEVPASIGSPGGIRAAADGAIDLGLISRPLRENEKGLGLVVVPYAKTGVVFGVNMSVPDQGMTYQEFISIYRGIKTKWKNGSDIIVLTREPDDSTIAVLLQGVPGFREAYEESQRTRRWSVVLSDQEMNRLLGQTNNALGFSDTGAIVTGKLPIKPLTMNGVEPTPKNIRSGKYPLHKQLAFVYRKDRLSEGAKKFIAFVGSAEGERILMQNGYVPGK